MKVDFRAHQYKLILINPRSVSVERIPGVRKVIMKWTFLIMTLATLVACSPAEKGVSMNELPDFNSWWDYSDPAATETRFRELLPEAEKANDLDYLLQLKTQIGRTLGLQQKFDEAHAILDEVEAALNEKTQVADIRYLLERGRTLNSSGFADSSYAYFKKAWERGLQLSEDFYTVDAAHMLAIVTPPEDQLRWNENALSVAEASEDERTGAWLGSLYNNIGWTYHGMENYEQAMKLFEKALAWRIEKKQEREIEIARWCVARTHRSMGNFEEALTIQRQIEMEIASADRDPDGYVAEEIGECLLALGRKEESQPHFKQAYELLSQDIWMQRNETERLERLKELGGG